MTNQTIKRSVDQDAGRHIPTRAKTLDEKQFKRVVAFVRANWTSRVRGSAIDPGPRNLVAVYLSFYAGLRPHEISGLEWSRHILDASGDIADVLTITNDIGKKSIGRQIPFHPELKKALAVLRLERPNDVYVFHPLNKRGETERNSANAASQFFKRLYVEIGFDGCSAYSGRRTFVTSRARQANLVGSSLRDVQLLAGHSRLETTAGYIEFSEAVSELASLPLHFKLTPEQLKGAA